MHEGKREEGYADRGAGVAISFWRTSLIFSCRMFLFGKTSLCFC